jgi:hypothetical protein
MPFAVTIDVPASWDTYRRVRADLGDTAPDGLIVHVAGPTDEGFRIVDLWETEESFMRFRQERLAPAVGRHADETAVQPTIRGLHVDDVLEGTLRVGALS